MNKIVLIGTAHLNIESENGKYNANILYDIIKKFKPNVIFEETTINNYIREYIYNEKSLFIERYVIKKYTDNYNIKNIPIDTLEEPNNLSELHDKLTFDLRIKNENNGDLIELINVIDDYIVNNGITGINSVYFDDLIFKRHKMYEHYISNYRNILSDCYCEYISFICEKRESVMVENIIKYKNLNIRENRYLNAVVLIGAAHKKSIETKLKKINNIICESYYSKIANGI